MRFSLYGEIYGFSMHGEKRTQVATRGHIDDKESDLVNVAQAMKMLGGIGRSELYVMLGRGEILGTKFGRRRMFFRDSVERLIAEKKAAATAAALEASQNAVAA